MENDKKKKESYLKPLIIIALILACSWGLEGSVMGGSFLGSIFQNIILLIVGGIIIFAIVSVLDK